MLINLYSEAFHKIIEPWQWGRKTMSKQEKDTKEVKLKTEKTELQACKHCGLEPAGEKTVLQQEHEERAYEQEPNTYKERYMRMSADFTNYKRRMEKDRLRWASMAQATILKALLPIVDDLDRAVHSAGTQSDGDEKSEKAGVQLITKNIHKLMDQLGIKSIDCTKEFNPEYHEALMYVESPDHKHDQIVTVIRPGYLFKDEVFRPAQVGVAK